MVSLFMLLPAITVLQWLDSIAGTPLRATVDRWIGGMAVISTIGYSLTANRRVVRNLVGKLFPDPTMLAPALTKLAVVIGGRKRAWRADEWAGDLATGSDPAHPPGTWARIRHSADLVRAAVRWRVGDLLNLMGRILDWTLAEPRTEVFIMVATLCSAAYFWRTLGLAGLMANFENVLATAVLTSGLLWLRKYRHVPPARRRKRKATRR
jgi:hypothetical protein